MPFRPMTEKEKVEAQKLINNINKSIERLEYNKAQIEAQIIDGIYTSDIDWSKK